MKLQFLISPNYAIKSFCTSYHSYGQRLLCKHPKKTDIQMMSSRNSWDILLTKSRIRFVEISLNLLYNKYEMGTFIVNAKDKAEFNFLSDLFKKLKINARVFSTEEKEDFALGEMMSNIDRSKKVSHDSVMAKLNKK